MGGSFVTGPVTVSVPATSANLGPGYDSFGVALGLRDQVTAEVYGGPLVIEVQGEGADLVPRDASHLVVRSMAAAFAAMGVSVPGLRLRCQNVIPHARGMGSSSAAIVGGIVLARALVRDAALTDAEVLDLANRIEGHPDNVAPALLGGFTIAVSEQSEPVACARLQVVAGLGAVVLVPAHGVHTRVARELLPDVVSHHRAALNTGRAGLLVAALQTEPQLLLAATRDELHQEFRRSVMPDTLALVDLLRAARIPAVVSGAGPSVLAFVVEGGSTSTADVSGFAPAGWTAYTPELGVVGAYVL